MKDVAQRHPIDRYAVLISCQDLNDTAVAFKKNQGLLSLSKQTILSKLTVTTFVSDIPSLRRDI